MKPRGKNSRTGVSLSFSRAGFWLYRFGLALSFLALLPVNFAGAQTRLSDGTEAAESRGTNCSQKRSLAAQAPRLAANQALESADPYQTAYNYLVTFYPRWFTWQQGSGGPCNRLVGPNRVTPLYHVVVAINVDTLYASTFLGLKDEPVILTIPKTQDIYSVLHLDQYGALVPNGLSGTNTAGVYAIVGPDWAGTLPEGVTRVNVPYNYSELLFRADKFSPQGKDMKVEAEKFRRNLRAQGLLEYLKNPKEGATDILPARDFAFPFKTFADGLISTDAIEFLRQTMDAVASATTQPLTQDEETLSDTFDALFSDRSKHPQLAAGGKAGHEAIIDNYLSHTISGSTWTFFDDIANWDLSTFQGYLNRASITEFCQYCNNHNAAAYFHTFLDAGGEPLDGSTHRYVLTFAKGQQPTAERFWSLTAYTPEAIELVQNKADKYAVASYTPGLVTAKDGSVTIVISTTPPADKKQQPNWLPIPSGPFNIMLRVYGPEGSVLDGTYVPPPVTVQ
jgi:hypothetical protein